MLPSTRPLSRVWFTFMRVAAIPLAVMVCAVAAGCPPPDEIVDDEIDVLTHVDPIIGTGGGGFGQPQVFVGATEPFGFVRLGPDTAGELPRDVVGFAHTSGYWYPDVYIEGFSHLHLSGTGIEDFGNVLVMPTFGMTTEKTTEDGYRQSFSHDAEHARAGHYSVVLDESGVLADLTATTHAGFHRYTFPSVAERARADDEKATLIVDVGHGIGRDGASDANVDYDPATGTLVGEMWNIGRFTGEGGAFAVSFSIAMDPPPTGHGTFETGVMNDDSASAVGPDIGMWFTFDDDVDIVNVRTGVSFLDKDTATSHRKKIEGRTFDSVRDDAQALWRERLSVVKVSDNAASEDRTVFYTALYHALLMPTRLSETSADGSRAQFRGLDGAVHDDDGVPYFSDLSMWDTYRTAHPLYNVLFPDDAQAFAHSILRMAQHHGTLPRWPLAVNETGTMLGTPATIIVADSALRGVDVKDAEELLAFMMKDADSVDGETTRGNHASCLTLRFCPEEDVGRGVASAIEWAAADFALASWLKARGDDVNATRYFDNSDIVRGHFDPATEFLRAKTTAGDFADAATFDPTAFTDEYAEGNAWQYFYAAPFATPDLMDLVGGRDAFVAKTMTMFQSAMDTPPRLIFDNFRAMDPYYWHGNEPDWHAPFMLSMAGAVDDAASVVEWIRATKYNATEDGLDGNDDGGALSSWIVLADLGFFPLPGTPYWILTPPRFDEAVIDVDGGMSLTVRATRASSTSRSIERVSLDDAEVTRAYVTHDELRATSVLTFHLVDAPTGFGADDTLADALRAHRGR